MELRCRLLPCPLVHAEDQTIRVFGLLHRGQHHIVRRDRRERVLRRQRTRVRRRHHRLQRIVVLPSVAHRQRVLPRARMRIERVVEMMMALVGIGIGPRGRAQQRKPQHVARGIVAVLVLVQHAQPVDLAIRPVAGKIGPAHRRNLKLRLLPLVVARRRPLDGAVRNLIGGKVARHRQRKRRLQQDVLLVPVDVVVDVDDVALQS